VARALSGGSIRGRLFSAFAAVAILPILLLAGLVLVLLTRSFERTAAARLESAAAAVTGAIARMESSARARLAAVAGEDLAGADAREAAGAIGRRADLPAVEVVAPDGTVLSSLHWPAGFGLRDQDRTFAGTPRFRMEKVSQGYGAVDRLAVVAEAPAKLGARPVVVRGGSFLDAALLDEISRLTGAAVGVRDEASGWIAPARSPLPGWSGPAAGAPSGEAVLGGERYRWTAEALAPGLTLVVAVPRAEIAGVLGGIGRATVIAGIIALVGALAAASLLSSRIAAPVTEELRESRERVLQAERVAAWREMARRLAHELKNPIFPIQLSIETLGRVAADDPRGERLPAAFREASGTILEELRALRKIIDEFSEFARMPAPRPAPIAVNEVVGQTLALYRPQAYGVDVRAELAEGLPPVTGDRDLIARALGNLVGNALDAMAGSGRLVVRTSAAEGAVRVDVEDTGPGLGGEQRTRLFTPYYTTKKGGTGLGLAIVQGIVSDHGGHVDVASAPGQGTTFSLFLPVG
jgi:signal transduction histidine kinase